MALLFEIDRTRITRHANNILNDNELPSSVCAENALTASDGKIYSVKYYNLDMIIAVGYRVNSKRGTQFRRWANSILKQYLLNGYAINSERIMAYQSNILQLEANVINIENRLKNLAEHGMYEDLIIWYILCLIFAVVFIVESIVMKVRLNKATN
ncbi:MAG: virulence RhuM family protein [Acholeplasmatales bacterium]|nr:virulence RhuM family protein [Acholeplasmatales bacterium]